MEDRLQANAIPTNVNKTEDTNSDPATNNTNNANMSQVSDNDNLNNSRLSNQQLSFKGSDRLITNCAEKFSDMIMSQEKEKLESSLLLKKRAQFTVGQNFHRDWYDLSDKKFVKTKLGKLSECSIGAKDKLLVRSLWFDRISTY